MSENNTDSTAGARKANRLIAEQSPYLRQHAYNPVDWYPWCEEAFARAKTEDKPILLSIGYSACHWCHVMERESFDDEETARLINELFIPIKVDREERPDIDQIYMDAVQLISGRGGWPLTMFLTPDGRPFYGGTYFPPEDRFGLPSFKRVLLAVAQAYRNRRQDIAESIQHIERALKTLSQFPPSGRQPLTSSEVEQAARSLARHYDAVNGGLGQAPKFPNSFVFSLFLRIFRRVKDPTFANMVKHTLTKMAKGGIYDQIGGGFHRYSVDSAWLVPHFEKMLYDNALLSRLYLDASRALGSTEFANVAQDVFDYVLREMTSPEGGFYSSQDADSEGEEGKFFLWTLEEVRQILGPDLSPIAERFYDITEQGNFEGRNILHRTIDVADAARLFGLDEATVAQAINEIRRRLFAAREKRVKPARDEKVLAAWNGLMISAFAEGYIALRDRRYLDAARKAFGFVMDRMVDGGRLKRSYKDGVARFDAYLEDYACMASAALDLYEATFDRAYLTQAETLAQYVLEHFADQQNGGFFFTAGDHEELIVRSKPVFDGSTPSGNSEMTIALLRLYTYTGNANYLREAERVLTLLASAMLEQPIAFARMLEAADFYAEGAEEIVLVGDTSSEEFAAWTTFIGSRYVPNRALFVVDSKSSATETYLPESVAGKVQIGNRLTAYICKKRTCSPPQTTLEGLSACLNDS